MRVVSLALYSVWTLILLGVGFAIWKYWPSAKTIDDVAKKINPANPENIVNTGATAIVRNVMGNDVDSPGTAFYTLMYGDENLKYSQPKSIYKPNANDEQDYGFGYAPSFVSNTGGAAVGRIMKR